MHICHIWLAIAVFYILKVDHLTEAQTLCKDKAPWCEPFKSQCGSVVIMQEQCQKTCKFCPSTCSTEVLGCQYSCTGKGSAATCTCPTGLLLNGDRKTCRDVDECSAERNPCTDPSHPVCINSPGSYVCNEQPICQLRPQTTAYYNRSTCCKKEPGSCGQNVMSRSSFEGNADTILAQWPWAALLLTDLQYCSAVLISDRWVISAAHCFGNRPSIRSSTVTVAARSTAREDKNEHTKTFRISKIVIHPNYHFPINDIALIKLEHAIDESEYVRPICLPNGEVPEEGASCFLSSYESEFNTFEIKRTLKEAGMFVSLRQPCERNFGKLGSAFTQHHLCAKHDNVQGGCPGETGGPLVCQRCSSCSWYVAAISTFGGACPKRQAYGIFTSIESYEDWISSTTNIPVFRNSSCNLGRISWRPWGTWSSCDRTCDGGQRSRRRTCSDGSAGSGGCSGPAVQVKECNLQDCSSWRPWGAWSSCDRTCDGGQRSRRRTCSGGSAGSGGCSGPAVQVIQCNLQDCPRWSKYSSWSECSKSCGPGRRSRKRSCVNGSFRDIGCHIGSSIEAEACNVRPCGWSKWSDFDECSVSCGKGQKSRTRTCLDGEGNCPGSSFDYDLCQLTECPYWSKWSTWSSCSRTCGQGTRNAKRRCVNGDTCLGSASKDEPCNKSPCQKRPCANETDSIGSGFCTSNPHWCTRFPIFMAEHCRKTCCKHGPMEGFTPWMRWSECTVQCGKGKQHRERQCVKINDCDGYTTIPLIQERECNTQLCETLSRSVTLWSACSTTCGSGTQQRTLTQCKVDGSDCKVTEESQACSNDPCPPTWSAWKPWTKCSATCGPSYRSRSRVCGDSLPADQCTGRDTEKEDCDVPFCGGSWTDWSPFSPCSATCGTGTSYKRRICVNGIDCEGKAKIVQNCSIKTCESEATNPTNLSERANR